MAYRIVLTKRATEALFSLPTHQEDLLHHYLLADEDIEIIKARRRLTMGF